MAEPGAADPDAYFVRVDGEQFRATRHTTGAWSTTEQHIAPMLGLVVHELERDAQERGTAALALGRMSYDLLGVIGITDFTVRVEPLRIGRTIELVGVLVESGGREIVRARGWRLAAYDSSPAAGGDEQAMPPPTDGEPWSIGTWWPGDFLAGLEVRAIDPPEPGRRRIWVRSPLDLVASEGSSDLARLAGLFDVANGLAVRKDPKEWFFANVDLTAHFFRRPSGRWLGYDIRQTFGADGMGLTATVLHDVSGSFGRQAQCLTVRPQ